MMGTQVSVFSILCFLCLSTLVRPFNKKDHRSEILRNQLSKRDIFGRKFSSLFSVKVYDDVIETSICKIMDYQLKLGGLGHTVFVRELPPRTVVESVINAMLTLIGDESPIVEYWWREEWINLELHRDLDEKLAVQNGPIRFPDHAHVLYLCVGEEALGSTIVLKDSTKDEKSKLFDEITIVPAIAGRLLRFTGDMMHGVPRPSLAYLDPAEGGTNLELWNRRRPADENDPELNVLRRSVLLFNTWTGNPPAEISQTPPPTPSGAVQELLDLEKQCTDPGQCRSLEQWKDVSSTVTAPIDLDSNAERIRLKIGLLGDIRRRERSDRYLNVYASRAIKDAFTSNQAPIVFSLSQLP